MRADPTAAMLAALPEQVLGRLDRAGLRRLGALLAVAERYSRGSSPLAKWNAARTHDEIARLLGYDHRPLLGQHTASQQRAHELGGPLGEAALALASRGVPVLPLHYPVSLPQGQTGCSCRDPGCTRVGKHPLTELTPRGVNDATTDPVRIGWWWRARPHANLGAATGVVFDAVDVDGPQAAAALGELAREMGLSHAGPLVRTGRAQAGWHYLFSASGTLGNRAARTLPGVELRTRGGYVVAPPSRHASGRAYTWARGLDAPLGELPGRLAAEFDRPTPTRHLAPGTSPAPSCSADAPQGHPYGQAALDGECAALARARPGSRHHRLRDASLRLHSLAATGLLEPDQVHARLLDAAGRCGLGEREARRTIADTARLALRSPRPLPPLTPAPPGRAARPCRRPPERGGGATSR